MTRAIRAPSDGPTVGVASGPMIALPTGGRPGRYLLPHVAVYGVVAAVLLPWGRLLGPDASVFAVVGRMWLDGAVPYRDVFLGKPPFLVVLSAAGDLLGDVLGMGPSDGPRLISAVSVVVLALALCGLLRGYGVGRAAAFGAGLAAVFYFADAAFAGGGGLSEPPAFALALVGWWLAERSSGVGSAVLAGALAAAAMATSILAGAIVLAMIMAVLARDGTWGERSVRLVGLAVGGVALVAVPVIGWLAANGAVPAMWDQLVGYTRAYGAVVCPIPGLGNWPCFSETDRLPILVAYGFVIAPVAAAALLSVRAPIGRGVRIRLGLVLLVGVVLGLPTLRRAPSDHYWWPVVIALLPLGAIGLDILIARLRRPGHRSLPVVAAVLLVLLAALGTWRLHANLVPAAADAEAYADEVAAVTDAEPTPGPLFVWSMASPIYLVSAREPAGQMLHLYALSLPGYANADRFAAVCRMFADRRPIIVEEYPDLGLEPGAATPGGIDPAWLEPLRRLVDVDWRATVTFGRTRILVPRADPQLDAAACRPGS